MDIKERLEDIKLEFKQRPYLRNHSIEWLIEQVEEQQKTIKQLKEDLSFLGYRY